MINLKKEADENGSFAMFSARLFEDGPITLQKASILISSPANICAIRSS
jgi:hypothetical protein